MKIKEEHYNTRGSAPLAEGGFVIGNDAHLIKLLRDSLYSNPILAICREIASNARDAHREMGTPDRPIRINLPNLLSDDIQFQDWGPGISPVRIDTVYRQIGNSTKRDSNEETGGFGLGAKTPFAYTASFIVDTISKIEIQFDVDRLNKANDTNFTLEELLGKNIKCNYICSLGGDCGPNGSVKCYSADITDEPTGTTITIGVEPTDRNRFKQAVVKSTKHWNVKPELCGDDCDTDWPDIPAEIVSGNRWSLREKIGIGQFAIVDGIEYPLKISAIIEASKDSTQSSILKALSEARFYVYANTGDVSLTPSREELHYNNHTLEFLFSIVEDIISSLESKLMEKITACETYREASIELSIFNNNVLKFGKDLFWKGNKLYSSKLSFSPALHEPIQSYKDPKVLVKMQTYNWKYSSRAREEKLSRDNKNSRWNPTDPILICDKDTVSRLAVEAFNQTGKSNTFHVLVPKEGDIDWLITHVKDKLGINLFEIGAELLSKYTPPRTSKARERGLSPAWPLGNSGWDDIQSIDREDGEGVYVSLMDRKTIIKTDIGGQEIHSVNKLRSIVNALGLTNDEVYGMRDDIIPKLGSGWTSIHSLIEKAKQELIQKYPLELRKKLYYAYLVSNRCTCQIYDEIIKNEIGNNDFEVLKDLWKQTIDELTQYHTSRDEFVAFGLTYIEDDAKLFPVEEHVLFKHKKKLDKKYPMLHLVDSWSLSNKKNVLKEYIEIMDLVKEAAV